METPIPSADIIRRKIEDHVAKKDLRAAVVQCEELEILVGLVKQSGFKSAFLLSLVFSKELRVADITLAPEGIVRVQYYW